MKNLTLLEFKYFWFKLTNGKSKEGNALLIKSKNISIAKKIIKELQEKKIIFDNDKINNNISNNNNGEEKNNKNIDDSKKKKKNKKGMKISELIEEADLRDKEEKKIDEFFENESSLSSYESISSSISESDENNNDNDNDVDSN